MGWTKFLTANKPVTEDDLQTVIDKLPEQFKGFLQCGKQDWGWTCAADVRKPKGNEFTISGAYGMSGAISESFTETFVKLMEELGYTFTIVHSY